MEVHTAPIPTSAKMATEPTPRRRRRELTLCTVSLEDTRLKLTYGDLMMFLEPLSASRSSKNPYHKRYRPQVPHPKPIAPRELNCLFANLLSIADQAWPYQALSLQVVAVPFSRPLAKCMMTRNSHVDVSLRHRVSSFLSLTVHYFAILFCGQIYWVVFSILHVSCAFSFSHRLLHIRSC